MEYKQSADTKIRFKFDNDALLYKANKYESKIAYENINLQSAATFKKSMAGSKAKWLTISIILASILFAISKAALSKLPSQYIEAIEYGYWMTFIIGAVIYFATKRTISFTMYSSAERTEILILKDKNHDAIDNEIKLRVKAKLKFIYGKIDFSNYPFNEIEKFKWLKDTEVINEDEFQAAFAKLKERTREFYLDLNPNVSPQDELQRYEFMKEWNIISETEYQKALENVKASIQMGSNIQVTPITGKQILN